MDTPSSESESYDRSRRREAHRRPGNRDRGRAGGSGDEDRTADISGKLHILANTLQDTSRNLTKVDQTLGQYRNYADSQAEAMAQLGGNLMEVIDHFQTQMLGRSTGVQNASPSSLHSSDLESDGHFHTTSPIRDFRGSAGRRRRSHSASVHFKDSKGSNAEIETVHRSLRDLHCDQQRLSGDLDREILRRNRADIETRQAMENLIGHVMTSTTQASVPSHVEQRLQELERGMRSEHRGMGRERRIDQQAGVSDKLQETSVRGQVLDHEREDVMAVRLLKAERFKVDQERQRVTELLKESEDSREALVQEVEDLRTELMKMRKEKAELQSSQLEASRHVTQSCANDIHGERGRGRPHWSDRGTPEKEDAELRIHRPTSTSNEDEGLRKTLEKLSLDLARREQQLQRLEELRSKEQVERKEKEALLQESHKTRDELKTRAQEALRQWRAKCRRLQKELEEERAQTQLQMDKAAQAARANESSQAQLKALSQQTAATRRELDEILGRLAQREEELHSKDVELSDNRQRQSSLEQEIQELKEASSTLEEMMKYQAAVQTRLMEEKTKLKEEIDAQAQNSQRGQNTQAGLQTALMQVKAANARLSQQLASEEKHKKDLQKGSFELQAKLTTVQEEHTALVQQLQLERDVHQKELKSINCTLQLCQQERDEIQKHVRKLQADAASHKELCGKLQIKVDKMKTECDKMAAQLSKKTEAHALIQSKYLSLKEELEGKDSSRQQSLESESRVVRLEQKILTIKAEQEAVLSSMGEEVDAVCCSLLKNGQRNLKKSPQKPGLVKRPLDWLAETKRKLGWLCEEMQESVLREQHQRRLHQETKDQFNTLRKSWDLEKKSLQQRLDQQDMLLDSFSMEKKELLATICRKEEEKRFVEERVVNLETTVKETLEHCEEVPADQGLMENFRELVESQQQRDLAEHNYINYKEVIWKLQHQLDESRRKLQGYQEEKLDTTSRSLRLAALSSSIRDGSMLEDSLLLPDSLSTCVPHLFK
ncbi:centrosomal protein of 128 kDa isoform X1 [Takifugu rubripes]|uniref:Centrosomal protein 128 n=1 Tax=Takifugu rubripes TaxID=31033 RepID=H2VA47_TAKRU|nr:centrosomal protein of 128 kDa isoform X1 [Takifugu rubripes]